MFNLPIKFWHGGEVLPPLSSTGSNMICLDRVQKNYSNGSIGLDQVSLKLDKGDFLFITGHSGSGKSTLLKLIYGEEQATEGEVRVMDISVNKLRGDRLAKLRRRIGIVFQDYKLVGQRTVAENIAFVLMAQGCSRSEIKHRMAPALKMVGLTHKADCFPGQLSGGEQQRVGIARAIVNTPPLLLADEPTGNLDPENAWQVINIFKQLNSYGVTVLITTHDRLLVEAAAHPFIQLNRGKVVSSAS
jgi:cell division transport system ATP-binding protein